MKINEKQLRFLSGLTMLLGATISIAFDNNWKYLGVGIIIVGMILLAPWTKKA